MTWFDDYGLIHPEPQPSYSDNGIMFLALYCATRLGNDKSPYQIIDAIELHEREKGIFVQTPTSTIDPASHDNITSIFYLCERFKLPEIRDRIKTKSFIYRPWDFIFYESLKGKSWTKYFLWISCLAMIGSCLRTYKVKYPHVFIATDSKLLTYLKLNSKHMPTTSFFCNMILYYKFGENYWTKIFSIYFKNQEHPIIKNAIEIGI